MHIQRRRRFVSSPRSGLSRCSDYHCVTPALRLASPWGLMEYSALWEINNIECAFNAPLKPDVQGLCSRATQPAPACSVADHGEPAGVGAGQLRGAARANERAALAGAP